jgi:hypothetical protein
MPQNSVRSRPGEGVAVVTFLTVAFVLALFVWAKVSQSDDLRP